jgi:hypothetical protein
MKRILLAGIILSALTGLAGAADLAPMAVKAPPLGVFAGGSGLYWGIGTESSAQNVNSSGNQLLVSGLVSGNIEATGQAVKGVVGYIWGVPGVGFGSWKRVEISAAYQNVTGANAVAGSVASRWSSTAEFDIGADVIAYLFSALPSLSGGSAFNLLTPIVPSLPSNIAVVAAPPRQYVGGMVKCEGVSGSIGVGTGAEIACGPGLKTGFIWQTADQAGKPSGKAIDLYASVAWMEKGFSISGVGAAGGGAPVFAGGMSMGPQYSAGIVVDF